MRGCDAGNATFAALKSPTRPAPGLVTHWKVATLAAPARGGSPGAAPDCGLRRSAVPPRRTTASGRARRMAAGAERRRCDAAGPARVPRHRGVRRRAGRRSCPGTFLRELPSFDERPAEPLQAIPHPSRGSPRPPGRGGVSELLPRRLAITVFLAFAFAYFFSALLRDVTATLSPTLAGVQPACARPGSAGRRLLPGLCATRLPLGTGSTGGPKKVILAFLGVAVVGCVAGICARHQFLGPAGRARALRCGVSACLMAPLTGFRRWFARCAGCANSWMLMTGSFGMVASTCRCSG